MSKQPSIPLNCAAASVADNELYAKHEKDPRPNAMFDANGARRRLSACDKEQERLRQEWVDLYAKAGGKLEERRGCRVPGTAIMQCPKASSKLVNTPPRASLYVTVIYDPLPYPVANTIVTIVGPVTKSVETTASGVAIFSDLPEGAYRIHAQYKKPNPLVDSAEKQIGKTDWAKSEARTIQGLDPYYGDREIPLVHWSLDFGGNYKCSLFVFEMLVNQGYSVPTRPNERRAPLAEDWANVKNIELDSVSSPVLLPEPGDIIAWRNDTYNASGHNGIVSYPIPLGGAYLSNFVGVTPLVAGQVGTFLIKMRRRTISAQEDAVVEDARTFWHFYDEGRNADVSKIVFRRMK